MDKIRQQAREGLAAPGIADADVDHIDEDLVLEYLGGARGVDEAVLNEYGEPAEGAPGQQGAGAAPAIQSHQCPFAGPHRFLAVFQGGRRPRPLYQ